MIFYKYADGDPTAYTRVCEWYPGWQVRTDLQMVWLALRGGVWSLRLADGTLAGLADQMERVELAEWGELDRP